MIDAPGSSRHPLGQLAYRIISGNVWYDCRKIIEDQKIGHCESSERRQIQVDSILACGKLSDMHIPPRAVIFSQLLGSLIGLPGA
jgi:hypothetical protein